MDNIASTVIADYPHVQTLDVRSFQMPVLYSACGRWKLYDWKQEKGRAKYLRLENYRTNTKAFSERHLFARVLSSLG